MIRSIVWPNNNNILVWANFLFLMVLLLTGYAAPITVVLAYFLETIIIGFFHVFKLYIVSKKGKPDTPDSKQQFGGMMIIPFFIFHYGMFVAIQSMFVFSFFQQEYDGIKNGFDLINNYMFALSLDGMYTIITSLFITNLGYFYTNFLSNQKYLEYAPSELFFKPYIRIFIQQFAVILAGFFMVIAASGMAAAILLMLFRLPVDLIIVSLHKNSKSLEQFAKKHSGSYQKYVELKKKYQQFSE